MMSKRKLDEFLELAKNLSASDIAESLKALGPRKCRRIVSDPKLLQDTKGLQVRTTPQLYEAFKYLLTQRAWAVNTTEEERELWFGTMEILDLPSRNQVKFLDRAPFMRAFEHAMLTARQFQMFRKEEETNQERGWRQWPSYPKLLDFSTGHPNYQDSTISYELWLNDEDREVDDTQDKSNMERRERLEKVTKALTSNSESTTNHDLGQATILHDVDVA